MTTSAKSVLPGQKRTSSGIRPADANQDRASVRRRLPGPSRHPRSVLAAHVVFGVGPHGCSAKARREADAEGRGVTTRPSSREASAARPDHAKILAEHLQSLASCARGGAPRRSAVEEELEEVEVEEAAGG